MHTYIVTGSDGFIGGRLSAELENMGHRVIPYEIENVIRPDWKILLEETLSESGKIECVFHVGACSDTLNTDVNSMMLLNYEFSRVLGNMCSAGGIKLIYSSSAACYGVDLSNLPANLYGWSKYAAESHISSNEQGVSLRYFNVFGPGEHNKGRMASVGYQSFVKHFIENKEVGLFPGNPMRDFVHVDDVVYANLQAYKNYNPGEVYDVGSCTPLKFEEFLSIMDIPFVYLDESQIPEGYQFYTTANIKKTIPGWLTKKNIKTRIEEYSVYLQDMRKNGIFDK